MASPDVRHTDPALGLILPHSTIGNSEHDFARNITSLEDCLTAQHLEHAIAAAKKFE